MAAGTRVARSYVLAIDFGRAAARKVHSAVGRATRCQPLIWLSAAEADVPWSLACHAVVVVAVVSTAAIAACQLAYGDQKVGQEV